MLGISGFELMIILFFGFLVFGPEKLPQMGRTVGRAIRQFRQASDSMNQKFKEEVADPFQEAISPYKDSAEETLTPLKEDLEAINKTFDDTKSMISNPIKNMLDFDAADDSDSSSKKAAAGNVAGAAGAAAASSAASDSLTADPFAEAFSSSDDSDDPADGQPIPETVGTVKKSVAASLYELDEDDDASADDESSDKDGE